MTYNEQDIATLVQQRLGLPASKVLGIQTLIGAALNNLAQHVACDSRKPLLLTNPETVTVTVNTTGYTADLSTIIASNAVLLEYIRLGSVFFVLSTAFASTDVSTVSDSINVANSLEEGQAIRFTTTGVLPTPIVINTTYYAVNVGASSFQISTTTDPDDFINITAAGSGSSTVAGTGLGPVMQWLASPNQGELTSCLPISYTTGYLVGTTLYLNNATGGGTLKFSVPYQPTLAELSGDSPLINDLLDEIIALYVTKDPSET